MDSKGGKNKKKVTEVPIFEEESLDDHTRIVVSGWGEGEDNDDVTRFGAFNKREEEMIKFMNRIRKMTVEQRASQLVRLPILSPEDDRMKVYFYLSPVNANTLYHLHGLQTLGCKEILLGNSNTYRRYEEDFFRSLVKILVENPDLQTSNAALSKTSRYFFTACIKFVESYVDEGVAKKEEIPEIVAGFIHKHILNDRAVFSQKELEQEITRYVTNWIYTNGRKTYEPLAWKQHQMRKALSSVLTEEWVDDDFHQRNINAQSKKGWERC